MIVLRITSTFWRLLFRSRAFLWGAPIQFVQRAAEGRRLIEREAELQSLNIEVQRVKDLLLSPIRGESLLGTLLASYLGDVWSILCAKAEAIEAADRLVTFSSQLMKHDRHFSDGNQEKFDDDRSSICENIRQSKAIIVCKECEIERKQAAFDIQKRVDINRDMDKAGFATNDPLRPSILLIRDPVWSEPYLMLVEAEIADWEKKLESSYQVDDQSKVDFRSYLTFISHEAELTREYFHLSEEIWDGASKIFGEEFTSYSDPNDILIKLALASDTPGSVQLAENLQKLKDSKSSSQFLEDSHRQQLLRDRAELRRKIDKVRARINSTADLFLDALGRWAVPSTSILPEILLNAKRNRPPSIVPTPNLPKRKRKKGLNHAFIITVGRWWQETHANGGRLSLNDWAEIGQRLEAAGFLLGDYLKQMEALKGEIAELNRELRKTRDPGIWTWQQLINFVRKGGRKNADIRRQLQKQFSEIYNEQYLKGCVKQ